MSMPCRAGCRLWESQPGDGSALQLGCLQQSGGRAAAGIAARLWQSRRPTRLWQEVQSLATCLNSSTQRGLHISSRT